MKVRKEKEAFACAGQRIESNSSVSHRKIDYEGYFQQLPYSLCQQVGSLLKVCSASSQTGGLSASPGGVRAHTIASPPRLLVRCSAWGWDRGGWTGWIQRTVAPGLLLLSDGT